jgi:predicted DNA-binding protein with PD1-like motif
LHISIADKTGKVLGGHMMDGCVVNTTAEVVIASLPGLAFRREYDARTGFKELCVEASDDSKP